MFLSGYSLSNRISITWIKQGQLQVFSFACSCLFQIFSLHSHFYFYTMINSEEQSDQDRLILLLSEKEKICLNSYLFNSSSRNEAYKAAKDITKDIDISILNNRAIAWINNKPCKAYISKYKDTIIHTSDVKSYSGENSENDFFTKEAIQSALVSLIQSTSDIKLKGDLLVKLNDIKGYKKDQNNAKEEQVHYFLPLRCDSCDYKRHNLTHTGIE